MDKLIPFALIVNLVWTIAFNNQLNGIATLSRPPPTLRILEPSDVQINSRSINSSSINFTDILTGTEVHLQCEGVGQLIWKYPENADNGAIPVKIAGGCTNKFDAKSCYSELMITNASYEQTGTYSCQDPEVHSPTTSIYIFINDAKKLLVPYDAVNDLIFLVVVQSNPATIPCRPTSSLANVTLWKPNALGGPKMIESGPGTGVTFNPTSGFNFESPKWDTESSALECRATLNGVNETLPVTIHISIPPVYGIKPMINDEEAKFVTVNGTFSLTCNVQIDVGVLITTAWDFPASRSGRYNMSSISKGAVEGYQQENSNKLTIWQVKPEDEGPYYCNVTDAQGIVYSDVKYIKVYDGDYKSSVSFSTALNRTYFTLNVRDTLKLVVNIHAIPDISLVQLFWYKDGNLLGAANKDDGTETNHPSPEPEGSIRCNLYSNHAVLTIKKLSMTDSGVYTLVGNTPDVSTEISITVDVLIDAQSIKYSDDQSS